MVDSKLTELCKKFLADNNLYDGESICISKEPYRADSENNVYVFLMEVASIVGYPVYEDEDCEDEDETL